MLCQAVIDLHEPHIAVAFHLDYEYEITCFYSMPITLDICG